MGEREWKEVRLGEVCNIRRGSSPRPIKDFLSNSGMPWVKIADATESNSRFIEKTNEFIKLSGVEKSVVVNPGSLILSNSGTAGLPKFMGLKACIHDGWQVFDNFQGINVLFLYYELLFIRNRLLHDAYDSTMKNLTLDMVRNASIDLPSMRQQKAIAATLSCLDDKIELNNRINKTLEEIAQAIFKSWFVDFEPFQDGEFEDSELGRIPKGWRVGTLGNIASITSGKRPLKKEDTHIKEMRIPVVGASNVMGYTNKALYNEKILITGRVGTHGIIQRFNTPCWPSDNTLVIKSGKHEFTYQVLKSIDFQSINRGSTQPLITQTDLKNITIVIPSDIVLKNFEAIISELMILLKENNNQTEKLTAIRDTLLPKLMSGEIRVPIEEVTTDKQG